MAIEKVVNITVKENGMDALKAKVNALENSLESLEDQNESLTKSMAGSSQSVLDNGGAMGLLNDLTGGLAMTVKDAVEATDLFTKSEKAKTIATTISTAVIGTSTGALKAFRIALAATGIGLLVVGLGLLIANFDKVVKFVNNAIDSFKGLSGTTKNIISVLVPFVGIIRLVSTALEELGIIEDENAKKLRLASEEREKTRKKDLASLVKLKDQVSDAYDFEIAKVKASGKDTEKIEAQKRDAILKTLQAQNSLDRARIASGKASQDEIKAWNERQKEIVKVVREIEIANIESQTKQLEKQKEANEKAKELRQKALEDRKRKLDEEYKAFLDNFNKELEKEASRQNAIAEIRKSYVEKLRDLDAETELEKIELEEERALAELERLNATESEKAELKKYYSKLTNDELIRLAEEGAKARTEKEKEEAEKRIAIDEAVKQAKYSIAGQTLDLIGQLAGEGTALAKGVAVAQATMSGIEGVQNAYTTAQKSPVTTFFPAYPLVQAGLAGAFSALQIKKILSTKTGGGGGGSSSSSGGGGGGSVPSAPSFNVVSGTGTNVIAESLASEKNPVKAYVVSSEVTSQQALDRNIENGATL